MNVFSQKEAKFKKEAADLEIGDILEAVLSLFSHILPLLFLDECLLAGINSFGSNVDLIDPVTANSLHTPGYYLCEDTTAQTDALIDPPAPQTNCIAPIISLGNVDNH